jgi:hypothetical protein
MAGLMVATVAAIVIATVASGTVRASAGSTTSTTLSRTQAIQRAGSQRVVTFGTQTSSSTAPDARDYYDYIAGPGGRLFDHIDLFNYSAQTITLLVRPTDVVNTPQGQLAVVPIDKPSTGVGTWVQIPPQYTTVTLNPRHHLIIPFSVAVPKSAIPGDHTGAVTVTLQSTVISKSGQRVHLDQTTGTRMFIRVSGPLHPLLQISDLKVHYAGSLNPLDRGKAVLTYVVRNVGNVDLGGKQTVYVSGLFGTKAVAKTVPNISLLLPGYSTPEKVTVSNVYPTISESAHVRVNLLYLPGSVQPPSGPFYGTVHFLAIPWIILLVIVLLIAAAVFLLLRRRRRRRKARAAKSTSGGPKPTGGSKKTPPRSDKGEEGESDDNPLAPAMADAGNGKVEERTEEVLPK